MNEARLTIKPVTSLAQIESQVLEGIKSISLKQRAMVLGTLEITMDSRHPAGSEYQHAAGPRGFHIIFYPWKIGMNWIHIVLLSRDEELSEVTKLKVVTDFIAGLQ